MGGSNDLFRVLEFIVGGRISRSSKWILGIGLPFSSFLVSGSQRGLLLLLRDFLLFRMFLWNRSSGQRLRGFLWGLRNCETGVELGLGSRTAGVPGRKALSASSTLPTL